MYTRQVKREQSKMGACKMESCNMGTKSTKKPDARGNRTPNLSIWSRTRYHCATTSSFFRSRSQLCRLGTANVYIRSACPRKTCRSLLRHRKTLRVWSSGVWVQHQHSDSCVAESYSYSAQETGYRWCRCLAATSWTLCTSTSAACATQLPCDANCLLMPHSWHDSHLRLS